MAAMAMTADARSGKHSRTNAAVPVSDILTRAIVNGDAIRLAWPDGNENRMVNHSEEFPTGVLPVVRHGGHWEANQRVEPTGEFDPMDDQMQPSELTWRPGTLAG